VIALTAAGLLEGAALGIAQARVLAVDARPARAYVLIGVAAAVAMGPSLG
jgi:hypothetical protein